MLGQWHPDANKIPTFSPQSEQVVYSVSARMRFRFLAEPCIRAGLSKENADFAAGLMLVTSPTNSFVKTVSPWARRLPWEPLCQVAPVPVLVVPLVIVVDDTLLMLRPPCITPLTVMLLTTAGTGDAAIGAGGGMDV